MNGAKLTFDQASGLQVIDKSLPSVSKSIQFVVKDTTAWMHVRARMRVCRGGGEVKNTCSYTDTQTIHSEEIPGE